MLALISKVSKSATLPVYGKLLAQSLSFNHSKRFQSSLGPNPKKVATKISDSGDPNRSPFFEYSWGSWLKNNEKERKMRETKFSISGVAQLINNFKGELESSRNVDKNGNPVIKPPKALKDGSIILVQNLLKELKDLTKDLSIKSIASIHEGKHHRIYKITLASDKELILRLPYKLESAYAISQKIKSEVATMDFLALKLGLNVPRVVAYGVDRANILESPFILMEYVEGNTLMRKWNPLIPDSTSSESDLKAVITPIAEFHEKLISITFNRFGSLYFFDDVNVEDQSFAPYEDESDSLLKDRWRIGPSVERVFSRNKSKLSAKQITKFSRAIDSDKPLAVISAVPGVEIENLKNRLALAQADAGDKIENVEELQKVLTTFYHLNDLAPVMFNPFSKSIQNVEELFKPRLFCPDLDPLNVILSSDPDGSKTFLDFEYSCIKPFILTSYPSFVAYQGYKIYNLEDVPQIEGMDDTDKQQYEFMYYKTRNERLWELELNTRRHDLISIASPFIKLLKNPYIQALEFRRDKDHLYIEEAMIQVRQMWDTYASNDISGAKEFPIDYDDKFLLQHRDDLEAYQKEVMSTPFAATGGWVPQDMFESLKDQGIIVETDDGNYTVDSEKVLK